MSTRQNTAGFTLLELMIVLAIGALIMTMAIPSFRDSINNQRLVTATNELVMSLTLAKSEAIKRVSYVTVCKSSDGESCTGGSSWNDGWIVFANTGTTSLGAFDVGDELIRVYSALPDSLEITAIGNVGDFVSFRPSGTLGTNAGNQLGTFTTCDYRGADAATAIVMQPSGRWQVSHDKAHDDTALTCA